MSGSISHDSLLDGFFLDDEYNSRWASSQSDYLNIFYIKLLALGASPILVCHHAEDTQIGENVRIAQKGDVLNNKN